MAPTIDAKVSAVHDLPTPEPESPLRQRKPYRFSTLCATVENPELKDQYGSSSVPIYQSATFKGVGNVFDYSRSGNPTRSHLEHHIAKISSANHAMSVASGMAALDVILRLLKPGDEVIAGDDLYGGTNRLLSYIQTHGGVIVHHVDTTDPASVLPFINPTSTRMVLLESPTNPLLKIVDLAAISKDVKERAPNALVVVDNTMMSPYLQRPLEHGADIVYDSATKYLSGHHDLMAGVITCNRDDLHQQMAFTINAVGNALAPNDCFLLLRGTKTLALRMDRQQTSSQLVAAYLHNLGFTTHYPGLPNHPNRQVHARISSGNGAVLSFETGNKELSERIVGGTRLWGISVSFGCVNSLISMPCVMSHASIDAATRAARGLPEDLIRLCVGIEDPVDLIDDLEHALIDAGAITFNPQLNNYARVLPPTLEQAVQKLGLYDPRQDAQEWFVSAPGKVILFGEHAVVHGVPAIAASIDLRCYGLATPRDDAKLSVHFADIDNFYHEWDIEELPWHAGIPLAAGEEHPELLDQALVDAINMGPLRHISDLAKHAKIAALAVLYIYIQVGRNKRPAVNLATRATLPVGAGLGSSASFSTCIASSLLLINQDITLPPPSANSDDALHVHQGRKFIPQSIAQRVNKWAFVSEKILHGTPSGIDNSVAVFGGALVYTKTPTSVEMEPIQSFKSLKFLLTNSKVPRDTKQLVAAVGALKAREPQHVDALFNAIRNISEEARRALADAELSRVELLAALSRIQLLIDQNHQHLIALGVSHPSLEAIRSTAAAEPFKLSTKLTGAGGGGCAVTLLPDEFQPESLLDLTGQLEIQQFVPYTVAVGGSGLGILSPYAAPNLTETKSTIVSDQMTPPETPGFMSFDTLMRIAFEKQSTDSLPRWADSLGHWLYV
ncbi:Cystathionine beta-lyase [Mycena indigotica]|uniref:Cystathionine beta-lyase n=1 Tax=Mycena indigotica TaxID=2126181 RepID=A0A8H6T899_9AGAR|nr:Cystathionine beta-lyase [Mycena indigotica]KAF7312172.1 Cystathionine beta-lyase [Mycena indigotica]